LKDGTRKLWLGIPGVAGLRLAASSGGVHFDFDDFTRQDHRMLPNTAGPAGRAKVAEEKPKQTDLPLILLIENDDEDIFFFRRALQRLDWKGDVRVVGSASEARLYMEGEFPFDDRTYYRLPQLIVSDFRLAGHTALDFISWLRLQPTLSEVPIVMLSGVASGLDAEKFARLGARGFVPKTGDVPKLAEALRPLLPLAFLIASCA
jgi:CheY-like chemotaxis protein